MQTDSAGQPAPGRHPRGHARPRTPLLLAAGVRDPARQGRGHPARQDRRRGLQDRQAAARGDATWSTSKGYRGILRKVLTPGRYRINKYAYDVKIVDVDACAEPSTRVKRKADDPTLIPPGYVGVVTNKASDPRHRQDRGIQKQVLQPGIYFLNPEEKRIDIVSIGYSETSLIGGSPERQQPARRTALAAADRRAMGDRLGTSTADDPIYVAGQGDRVPLQRRLSDPPRLHGDLGHPSRAGAGRRPPVRHAQGRRAEGDPAPDRVDLPAPRLAARRGGPAGRRHPRAIPERDLRRAGAGA